MSPLMSSSVQVAASSFHSSLRFSRHGAHRSMQRGITPTVIEYALTYGRLIQRTGVMFCVLGWRDIPPADRRNEWAAHLVGTVVLLDEDWRVITVYRKRSALRDIQRKLKRRITVEELASVADLATCQCDECDDDKNVDELDHHAPHV
ncbi:MAG: DUF4258 domain-containing protein [Ktedonobacterales bacterium]